MSLFLQLCSAMHTHSRTTLLIFFLAVLAPLAAAQDRPWSICGSKRNYTATSTYQANLDLLAAVLPKNASSSPTLFATSSAGAAPDEVYALALCRGGTRASSCHACTYLAFQDAQQECPYDREATLYYDHCLLRFSDQNFLASPANSADLTLGWIQNFTGEKFPGWDSGNSMSISFVTHQVAALLNDTAQAAASSTRRFAVTKLDISSSNIPQLYAMSQCTPDLSTAQCSECLQDTINATLTAFDGSQGARGLSVRCTHRYDTYPFCIRYPMLRILSSTGPEGPATDGSKRKLWIIGIVVPLLVILAFFIFCFGRVYRHRRGKRNFQEQSMVNFSTDEVEKHWRIEADSSEFTVFHFSQIVHATSNFLQENKLRQGGFGPVYKGRLSDGLEIAVKRLASHSGQGLVEFKNEIQLIAKLQHTNLVRLLGCCIQGEEKILIYEYMPNKSLDFFIFDITNGALLNWNKRLNIIEGIAQGLLYLHKHSRLRVIHRDLKASNILLDYDMNPKISDFGLAKIFGSNDIEGNTNRIVGT